MTVYVLVEDDHWSGSTVHGAFASCERAMQVATQEGRSYLGIDLNPAYIDLSKDRVAQSSMFTPELELA